MDPFTERKYLVFDTQLQELLSVCRRCTGENEIVKKEKGTCVEVDCKCKNIDCKHEYFWRSQPHSKQLALGNLVLAAAAFFTACSPTRLINVFNHCNIAIFTKRTYNHIQKAYLVPAVRNVWQRKQERLMAARRHKKVKLAGDGRCDSPGHCAKFGSYTLMDADTAEVLHTELVQVHIN